MCVWCVFSSHLFWTSSSWDVPAGVIQEEGHAGFILHLPSAVHALIFIARRIQQYSSFPSSTVKSIFFVYLRVFNYRSPLVGHFFLFFFLFFSEEESQLPEFELTSQRVRRLRGCYQLSYRDDRLCNSKLTTHIMQDSTPLP